MAESDRPTPDSEPGEGPGRDSGAAGGPDSEVILADGTPVGDVTRATTAEEMDELLDLFKDEMEPDPSSPAARMSERESEEEDLIRRAEALLGTTDPEELEHLAELHRAEAADQYARLSQRREEEGDPDAAATDPPAASWAETVPGETGQWDPTAALADELAAVEGEHEAALPAAADAIPELELDITAASSKAITVVDLPPETDALIDEILAEDVSVASEPPPIESEPPEPTPVPEEPAAPVASEPPEALTPEPPDDAAAAVADASAPPAASPDTSAPPEPEPAAAVQESEAPVESPPPVLEAEPAPASEPPALPESASAEGEEVSAEPEPSAESEEAAALEPSGVTDAEPELQAAAFSGGSLPRTIVGAPLALLGRLVNVLLPRALTARLGPGARGGVQWVATSKGRLAFTAGILAAVAAYVGFALFEADFSHRLLARRFPDATGVEDLQYFQAVADLERGECARARQGLRPLVAVVGSGREADIRFALGESYFLDPDVPTNLRFSRAREHYLAAIAADPLHPRVTDAHRRVAESYRAQELWPEAERAYRRLLDRYPRAAGRAEAHFGLAEVLFAGARYPAAADAFERVWNEFPEAALAPAARLRHGDVLLAEGHAADAQQLWQELAHARTAPTVRWGAIARLADLAETQGDLRGAKNWWEVWLRGAPHTTQQPAAWLKFATLAQQLGDSAKAASSFDFLVTAYPARPQAIDAALLRGRMHRVAGDTLAARDLYADLLVHAPEHPRLLAALRDAYLEEGNAKRAVEYAERAATAAPKVAAHQLRLAEALEAANEPAQALTVYWEMLARYPIAEETRVAANRLVRLLQAQGYTEEAYRVVTLYGAMAGGAASLAAVHEAKATLLAGMQLWDEAETELAAAVGAAPSDELRLTLAEVRVRTRNWAGVSASVAGVRPGGLDDAAFTRFLSVQAAALLHTGHPADVRDVMAQGEARLGAAPLEVQGLQAQALMVLGQTARAREMMERFDSGREAPAPPPPELAPTYLAWAEHLFAARIFSRAADYFGRVRGDVYSSHDRAWAAYQMANCYAHLQEYARAVTAYEAMIAGHPQAPWVPFAREKAQFSQLQADAAQRANRT